MTKNVSPCMSETICQVIRIFGTNFKMMMSEGSFFIFQNFDFRGFQCVCVCVCVCVSVFLCVCGTGVGEGLKRGKNNLKLHFSVCFAPYLRSFRPYHQDFNNEIYRCFSLYFFRKYNVVNIKIVLFFIGPLQQFF